MLRTLRIKFVVIIMALVGTVLVSVLGGSLYSTWQSQREMTDMALERSLHGGLRARPFIGGDDDTGPRGGNMLVLLVDVDSTGLVLDTNAEEVPVLIDNDVLDEVLGEALASETEAGSDGKLHIAWRKMQLGADAWRVVIADTSASYYTMQSLLIKDAIITVVALGALLAISVGLSTWVLKPVERAWDQQRRFVADASHELKTPLAVIIANTQILSKDQAIPEGSRRWIVSTADESAHMKSLVEELLELARADESASGAQGIMQKVDVDFSELVESSALEFDAIAFERGCLIEDDICEGIHVTGDPEWLGRLAKILIENACKYSAEGQTIRVRMAREGKRCVLEVNNHGQVIDPQDLPHVFDRFYRTDKARSRDAQTGGFGLGLAIAQSTATSHGGDIAVTSSEAEGTTFRVTLPCA